MNTLALKSHRHACCPRGSACGAYLTETRYELMRMVRNPGVAIPVLLMPVALYALFALLIAGEAINKDPNARHLPVLGILAHGGDHAGAVRHRRHAGAGARHGAAAPQARAAGAARGLGGREDRERPGARRCSRTRPSSSWRSPPASSRSAPGQVAALSGALLVGTIPFCAMGLMIGSLVSGSAAPGYANLIYLPGCYLSGHVLPAAEVHVLAGADLAAVPRRAVRDAPGGHHQVPVRAAADGDRHACSATPCCSPASRSGASRRRAESGGHIRASFLAPDSYFGTGPSLETRYLCGRTTDGGIEMSGNDRREFLHKAGLAGMFSAICSPAQAFAQSSGAFTVDPANTSTPEIKPDALDQVRGHRPRPRAHLRHDRRRSTRRRRRSSRSTRTDPAQIADFRKKFRDVKLASEDEILNDKSIQLVAGAPIPGPARAARHPRHEGRQGLSRRQARHHLAQAARRRAQGREGNRPQVRHHVFRAPRSALRRVRRRTHQARRHRPRGADREPRAASRERAQPARLVLRQGALRRHPLRHRLAPGRSIPLLHQQHQGARSSPRRPATSPIRSIRSSKTSATW